MPAADPMIIDFHTHMYPEKIRERAMAAIPPPYHAAIDGSRAGLLRSMEENRIDLAVNLPLVNTPRNARGVLAWAQMENHGPIRMLASLHPEDPDWKEHLERICDMGFPGLKLHPEYQLFTFEEERFFPFWEACEEKGLFILTHAGFDICFPPPFKTDPERLAKFHRRFPALKLVLAHLGGMKMWDDVEKYLAGLPVYLDTAMIDENWISPEQMTRIIRKHGADRILFGSDSPWKGQDQCLRFIRSLEITEKEKAAILGENAAGLLQIS